MKITCLCIILGLVSCNTQKNIEADSANGINKALSTTGRANSFNREIACVPQSYSYGNKHTNFLPSTIENVNYIYNSMDSGAQVIDSLVFNTPVNILAEYPDFFLICTPNRKNGYMKKVNLFLHSMYQNRYTYLFGIDNYGDYCSDSRLKVVKTNDKGEVVEAYHDSIIGEKYEIKSIRNSVLENVEALFYLNYNCYSGVGMVTHNFIVDNGKISRLLWTNESGDGGYSDESTIYIPIHLTNGKKIVLAKNGEFSVDETTGIVETYTYPKDCGIPIDRLIVVENRSVEMLWDNRTGEPKLNKDGTIAEKILSSEILYFEWDGYKLNKVNPLEK